MRSLLRFICARRNNLESSRDAGVLVEAWVWKPDILRRAAVSAIHKYLQDGILDVWLTCEGRRQPSLGMEMVRRTAANKHQK